MAQPALRLALVLALLGPPFAAAAQTPITQAQPQLARVPLALVTAGGRHRYSVEVATTPDQQERGLMFRTRMARDRGMIFPFAPPRRASFWMANTVLALDLVFVGADGRVLNVEHGRPYDRGLILSRGEAAAVLELNAGEAARIGLQPGDAVEWRLP